MRSRLCAALIVCGFLSASSDSYATVSTTTRTVDYTCSGGTAYSVTYPFLESADLTVTKFTGACGSATYSVLTEGVGNDYTVTRTGSESGTVTTTAACASGYCLRIARSVDLTQETSFRSQGSFLPSSHEDALDKITMALQQIEAGEDTEVSGLTAHKAAADDHSVYLLLAGRSGGQTAYGGTVSGDDMTLIGNSAASNGHVYVGDTTFSVSHTGTMTCDDATVAGLVTVAETITVDGIVYGGDGAGEDLELYSTSNATKGNVDIAGVVDVDETNTAVGVGVAADSALAVLRCEGDIIANDTLFGGELADEDLVLSSTKNADKDKVYLGSAKTSAYDEENDRLGIGTTSPSYDLHVVSDGYFADDLIVVDDLSCAELISPLVHGSGGSGNDIRLYSNTAGDGDIYLGTSLVSRYEDDNDRLLLGSVNAKYVGVLNVHDTSTGYAAYINNEGDTDADAADDGYYGLSIAAGDTACVAGGASATNCAIWVMLNDGNGDEMARINYVNGTGAAITNASDRRLKRDIRASRVDGVDTINAIPVREYGLRADPDSLIRAGFIAQELEEAWPEAVSVNEKGIYQVAQISLIPPLVKAVQELSAEVERLKSEQPGEEGRRVSAGQGKPAGPAAPVSYVSLFASLVAIAFALRRRVSA